MIIYHRCMSVMFTFLLVFGALAALALLYVAQTTHLQPAVYHQQWDGSALGVAVVVPAGYIATARHALQAIWPVTLLVGLLGAGAILALSWEE